MPLLSDIQASLLNGQDLAPILLKLRFLASTLGSEALEEWVKHESEGYPPDVEVPEYRRFPVTYTGSFNGAFGRMATNLQIPSYLIKTLAGDRWLQHEERQSVANVESLLQDSAKTGGALSVDASDLIIVLGGKVFQGMVCHHVHASIARGSLVEMQNALRARVLELAIQIDKNVPGANKIDVAQGATVAVTREVAAVTNNITTNTVYGNQNTTTVSNTGAGASISVQINQGDVAALQKALQEIGLPEGDAEELVTIVQSEAPLDPAKEPFGAKTKAWLGANLGKAADKLGFAVAAKLIADAISAYYGLA